ncbi:DUF3999 family protein [Arenibacter sp. GZD96]|uniref:DUF3999 family protein n=1 Tax=Aurantibrevibacter litoralis TaxID=3106030 RepID=UPI002AFEAC6E|nr:DUF3999 family protein [Arenibacter sp. GZD-96]MEA1786007.1 DUF3999 family protein [Arenibacter sp. GZD-96]
MLLLFMSAFAYGQIGQYNFKRELKGVSEQWHTLILPDEVFGKITDAGTDLRIFGITTDKDTIETPYFLRVASENVVQKEVAFSTLNTSHNTQGYYVTFEIPTSEAINQIALDFNQPNFDWQIKLEGSQNQKDWFTVLENYRILSIKNEITDFQFTTLAFQNSKYRFFRLRIESNQKPVLTAARIARHDVTDGTFRTFAHRKLKVTNNRETKQTEIDVELQIPVPLSRIKINVKDSFDYYRSTTLKYLTDSIKTEQGWRYNYKTLASGTLNSLDENEFKCNSTTLQRLKIVIQNQDNQPLTIDDVVLKGYVHEVVARFTEQGTYFLTYGNKNAAKPQYDIARFRDNVPDSVKVLTLGSELKIEKGNGQKTAPLFENKLWLWAIMGILIIVLGGFSIKMMRKE